MRNALIRLSSVWAVAPSRSVPVRPPASAPARSRSASAARRISRALQEVLALGGEVQTAADAVEERQAQLALEVADLARERGLREAQLRGGAGDIAGVGHADEVAEVP